MSFPKMQPLVRACWLLSACAALCATLPANAELRSVTAPTVDGTMVRAVLDTQSGLQWLTPQATMGLSYASVASGGYFSIGYRYATSSELIGLLGDSGYDTAPLVTDPSNLNWSSHASDAIALQGLIDLLGSTSGTNTIYGILADLKPYSDSPASDFNHALGTLSVVSPEVLSLVIALGPAFPTSDFNTGSFLVREVSAVPEPSTLATFAAGVLMLVGISRKRQPREAPRL